MWAFVFNVGLCMSLDCASMVKLLDGEYSEGKGSFQQISGVT